MSTVSSKVKNVSQWIASAAYNKCAQYLPRVSKYLCRNDVVEEVGSDSADALLDVFESAADDSMAHELESSDTFYDAVDAIPGSTGDSDAQGAVDSLPARENPASSEMSTVSEEVASLEGAASRDADDEDSGLSSHSGSQKSVLSAKDDDAPSAKKGWHIPC